MDIETSPLGEGLHKTSQRKIVVDTSFSPHWTGKHIFDNPVFFSPEQKYNGKGLYFDNQVEGGLLFFSEQWNVLRPGKNGDVLLTVAGKPRWGQIPSVDVLPIASGGTGITSFKPNTLLIVDGQGNLHGLELGESGSVLAVDENVLSWKKLEIPTASPEIPKSLVNEAGSLTLGDVFEIDDKGRMRRGTVPISAVDGVASISQGGTGLRALKANSIVVSTNSKGFGFLSASEGEGKYLTVRNGEFTWADCEGVGALSVGKKTDTVSWEKDKLYGMQRAIKREIAFIDSNIEGTASNVRQVVAIQNGGTGSNLVVGAAKGNMLVAYSPTNMGWLGAGAEGSLLMSKGPGNIPVWVTPTSMVVAKENSPITVERKGTQHLLSFNTGDTFHPNWGGTHIFSSTPVFHNGLKIDNAQHSHIRNTGELWVEHGELFYCSLNRVVHVSANDNSTPSDGLYIPLLMCAQVPSAGSKFKIKVPVPRCASTGSFVSWSIKRIEFRAETPPVDAPAHMTMLVNDINVGVDLNIWMGLDNASSESFNHVTVYSGDLLQIEATSIGQSDDWTVFVLLNRT